MTFYAASIFWMVLIFTAHWVIILQLLHTSTQGFQHVGNII